jgi:hypothetical protein
MQASFCCRLTTYVIYFGARGGVGPEDATILFENCHVELPL